MKKYEKAQAEIIRLQTSDVIAASGDLQSRGALGGFGADGVGSVGIDDII